MLQSVFIYADDLFILFSTGYWHRSWNGWGRGGGKKATCSHFSIPFLPTLNEDQLQGLNIFSMNLLLDCGGEIKTIEVLKWDRQQFAIGTPSLDIVTGGEGRGVTPSSAAQSAGGPVTPATSESHPATTSVHWSLGFTTVQLCTLGQVI